MEDTNSLIEQRKANLAKLRAKGIEPFQNKFTPAMGCGEARTKYVAGEFKEGQHVEIAGRITAHRDMGKSQFMDLKDTGGRIQIYAQKQTLGDEQFDIFKHLDLGDFIGVKGEMFTTKAGEPSVKITSFVILAKALRPPPAKWHGLEDTEIRYRQRYLDLMANDEVKKVFLQRSAIVHEIRQFFHSRGYVEVETPVMQAIPGGAAAAPFITKHNALGCDFYLRIALELYHKRLLVGGIDKLFEIGKNFRNEGLSRRHNPEFTMLEAYCAFGDYESMMETVEALITTVAEKVLGTLVIRHEQRAETISALNELIRAVSGCAVHIDFKNPELEKLANHVLNEGHRLYSGNDSEPSHVKAEKGVQLALESARILSSHLTRPNMDSRDEGKTREAFEHLDSARAALKRLQKAKEIDLSRPWRRARYKDLVCEVIRKDWFELTNGERLTYAEQALDVEVSGRPKRKLDQLLGQEFEVARKFRSYLAEKQIPFHTIPETIRKEWVGVAKQIEERVEYLEHGVSDFEVTQAVFEKLIEPTLIQPTFVTHLPKELVPLAKLSPDDPTTVEVFECCINGQEIAPGYTEQNDPIAQRNTLEHQAGGEQQKLDEDFLVALEHGMPPAGGIGLGIDRLCMMLLGQESIRDVILFPQLKPK
ncbi:MAG: hypothetical protein HY043_16065 [Verrucomicrobia bacterium]|nr:hypothetical protein [Verrucomicrobiota bacterium]